MSSNVYGGFEVLVGDMFHIGESIVNILIFL